MIALLAAALLSAPAAQKGPWLEMQAGPMFLHQPGQRGLAEGPAVRFNLGVEVSERLTAEAWMTGAVEGAPRTAPGDTAVLGGGVGGRFLAHELSGQRLGLYLHAGAGWALATAGQSAAGATGFLGPQLLFQPFVQRLALGLEADGVLFRNRAGLAVLPSLRAAF